MIALLKLPDLRAFLIAVVLAGLAESGLAVVLGVHVYALANAPLALGWLGLAEAVPAVLLVLVGGHVADRVSRKWNSVAARAGLAALALGLAAGAEAGLGFVYAVAFLLGVVRAFGDPALTGLEAELLPRVGMMRAVSLVASVGRVASLIGPVLGGVAYDAIGARATFLSVAVLLAASAIVLALGVAGRPKPAHASAGALADIREGLRYVFASQVIVGSMALDLFAVFFGGMAGLLPAFSETVLGLGAAEVGLMRAALSAGALAAMVVATHFPPQRRAGVVLHVGIAGFGLAVVVFGLSRSLALCLAALVVMGACDGISVVVRRAIVRMAAPDALRGRVAAVRGLFLSASNELGAFESGMIAAWLGITASIWAGGLVTMAVTGLTAWRAPKLLRLDLGRMERLQ